MNIRRNDIVVATRGRDKGKQGKVLQIVTGKHRAIVEGLCMVTKHLRKSQGGHRAEGIFHCACQPDGLLPAV
jgi:large subunit ribosomal protein L24